MPLIQTFDYHGKPMHIAKDRIVAIIQSVCAVAAPTLPTDVQQLPEGP